jgi:hypothetical protein
MEQTYALMHHGRIYTLNQNPLPHNRKLFRWIGYCDGDRIGFFKTKADFEKFVECEPARAPLGPHAEETFRAEAMSTFEGRQALNKLADEARARRGPR